MVQLAYLGLLFLGGCLYFWFFHIQLLKTKLLKPSESRNMKAVAKLVSRGWTSILIVSISKLDITAVHWAATPRNNGERRLKLNALDFCWIFFTQVGGGFVQFVQVCSNLWKTQAFSFPHRLSFKEFRDGKDGFSVLATNWELEDMRSVPATDILSDLGQVTYLSASFSLPVKWEICSTPRRGCEVLFMNVCLVLWDLRQTPCKYKVFY